jgi:hypothetical protein
MENNQYTGTMISPQEAKIMIEAFQSIYPSSTQSVFLGREKILQLLNQEDSMGIRTYFALNEQKQITIVLVGVDSSGHDFKNGLFLDKGVICPPSCNFSSFLED